jgi:hypothetical protein
MKTFNRILCLIIITVIIGFTTPADATQRLKYTGIARSTGGAVLGSATVTIYLAGTTTPANVYEASTGGDSVTSVTSDSNGRWTFYADVADYAFTQEYKVVVTKDGYSTITLDNIFNLSLPTNAVGFLYNDGSGNYSWGSSLSSGGITLADDSTLTLPAAAVDSGWTTGLLGFGPDGTGIFVNLSDIDSTIPVSGEITDEQVACWESSETPGTNKLKSCGAKTTDNSTATHLLCKDDSGEIENCTLSGLAISGTTSPTITVTSAPAIPSGTNPTVDAAGEIAVDTTTDQLQYYGGAKRVLPYIQYLSFVIPAPAEADDINIMKAPYGMTIIGINCIVQGTTSVTGQLQECSATGGDCADLDSDIACDADGAADDGSLTDSAIASGAWLRWKTTSLSGTPTFLTVTVRYAVVAD